MANLMQAPFPASERREPEISRRRSEESCLFSMPSVYETPDRAQVMRSGHRSEASQPTSIWREKMNTHAGRSQDERVAARKQQKQKAQEQPGGSNAVEGTAPDATHSSGKLSEEGKEVWRKGAGIDGGGKTG